MGRGLGFEKAAPEVSAGGWREGALAGLVELTPKFHQLMHGRPYFPAR